MSTFIHGIGASENIDSSGEIISIAGLDISSLDKDGVFNYEHKSDLPSQIVGKVLKAKKIFSDKDCDDDHQLYFWNKCKTPYLYVMGELFDDYKDSAREVAGMFRYDADKKNQNERAVMNFSVEGAKIHKDGMTITRSIARKITLTALPCNKVAVAEMVQVESKKPKKNDVDSLFKTEAIEIEILQDGPKLWNSLNKADGGASMPNASGLALSEKNMQKATPKLAVAKHPTARGNKLGTTSSGKDVYSHGMVGEYDNFSHADHSEAANMHRQAHGNSKGNAQAQTHHGSKSRLHDAAAHSAQKRAGKFAKPAPTNHGTTSAGGAKTLSGTNKLHNPALSGKITPPGPIKKADSAGSSLAGPSNLVGTAALTPNSIFIHEVRRPKKKKDEKGGISSPDIGIAKGGANSANVPKDIKIKDLQQKIDSGTYKPDAKKIADKMRNHPSKPLQKSKWLARAEQDYQNWNKREEYETFMKSRMPHLTKTEIKVIGQTMLLQKSLKMEQALAKSIPDFEAVFILKKEK